VGQQRFWVEGRVDHWGGSPDPATVTTTRAMGVILGMTDPRFVDSVLIAALPDANHSCVGRVRMGGKRNL
jgi:hypothetical protein